MTRFLTFVTAAIAALALNTRSHATWSICLADTRTGEVAVGTVTCLEALDLLSLVPVIVVGEGAAAAQAAGDIDGTRRAIIRQFIELERTPEQILSALGSAPGHQSRQYGIATVRGETLTFTGTQAFDWAGGVTGQTGDIVYAIQGNILTGACVVEAIEDAVINTDGDMAEKLMAGMIAADETGGDQRCSCPAPCGCPGPVTRKSGHIGGMVVARLGDGDDPLCNRDGCVDGAYFMDLNVAFQRRINEDPVVQLEALFADWRAGLEDRPDGAHSTASLDLDADPPAITIEVRDWRDDPYGGPPIQSVIARHTPESDRLSTPGDAIEISPTTFRIPIDIATPRLGTDEYRITINAGGRPVTIMPDTTVDLVSGRCGADWNQDGTLAFDDVLHFVDLWLAGDADFDGDQATGIVDLLQFLDAYFVGCP